MPLFRSLSKASLASPERERDRRPSLSSIMHGHGHSHASARTDSISSTSTMSTTTTTASAGTEGGGSSSTPSSASFSTISLPQRPHGHGHGHRPHLPVFPRVANFAVKLTIHQLRDVPLISGEFCVRWKFQHVDLFRKHANSHSRSDSRGFESMTLNSDTARGHAKGRPSLNNFRFHSSSLGKDVGSAKGKGKARELDSFVTDNNSEHVSLDSSRASIFSNGGSSSSLSSPRTYTMESFEDQELDMGSLEGTPSSESGHNVQSSDTSTNMREGTPKQFRREARGRTAYVPLRDHHVQWEQTVETNVFMWIDRTTRELQPCELKLIVEQKSDFFARPNPKLGEIHLNLAEFVSKGSVTRRHLLKNSRTNAMLQVTLSLTHIGGEKEYVAPPLQKAGVMASVSTLLNDMNELSGLIGLVEPWPTPAPTPTPPANNSTVKSVPELASDGNGNAIKEEETSLNGTLPSRLLRAKEGPEVFPEVGRRLTTEDIIETIFNPTPTTSSNVRSPFTYYTPLGVGEGERERERSPSPLSLYSSSVDAGLRVGYRMEDSEETRTKAKHINDGLDLSAEGGEARPPSRSSFSSSSYSGISITKTETEFQLETSLFSFFEQGGRGNEEGTSTSLELDTQSTSVTRKEEEHWTGRLLPVFTDASEKETSQLGSLAPFISVEPPSPTPSSLSDLSTRSRVSVSVVNTTSTNIVDTQVRLGTGTGETSSKTRIEVVEKETRTAVRSDNSHNIFFQGGDRHDVSSESDESSESNDEDEDEKEEQEDDEDDGDGDEDFDLYQESDEVQIFARAPENDHN